MRIDRQEAFSGTTALAQQPSRHVFDAAGLLSRTDEQLATCPDTGRLLLRLIELVCLGRGFPHRRRITAGVGFQPRHNRANVSHDGPSFLDTLNINPATDPLPSRYFSPSRSRAAHAKQRIASA